MSQVSTTEQLRIAVDTIGTEGVTQAMVVPTMLGRMLDGMEERGADLSSLRHLSYGGGRMPLPSSSGPWRCCPTSTS